MKSEALLSHNERETERIAERFAKTLRGGEVILLTGELGAGKTVFVRGLARGLGVRGRITSPTFVLMRVHAVDGRKSFVVRKRPRHHLTTNDSGLKTLRHFVHIDAYRIHDTRELEAIGLLEWVGRPDAVVAIEWGERIRRIAPPRAVRVCITGSEARRSIAITR